MKSIQKILDKIKEGAAPFFLNDKPLIEIEAMKSIYANMLLGENFYAPIGGMFFDQKQPPIKVKLPFKIVNIEYSSSDGTKFIYNVYENRKDISFVVFIFSTDRWNDVYKLLPYVCEVFYDEMHKFKYNYIYKESFKEITGIDLTISDIHTEYSGHVWSVLSLLSLLECTNVKTDIDPETIVSESVNKKREKNGKLKIIKYRRIIIDGDVHQTVERGGTHASPNWHYRRGHIRRFKNGTSTWVRSCTVGNIGEKQEREYTTKKAMEEKNE